MWTVWWPQKRCPWGAWTSSGKRVFVMQLCYEPRLGWAPNPGAQRQRAPDNKAEVGHGHGTRTPAAGGGGGGQRPVTPGSQLPAPEQGGETPGLFAPGAVDTCLGRLSRLPGGRGHGWRARRSAPDVPSASVFESFHDEVLGKNKTLPPPRRSVEPERMLKVCSVRAATFLPGRPGPHQRAESRPPDCPLQPVLPSPSPVGPQPRLPLSLPAPGCPGEGAPGGLHPGPAWPHRVSHRGCSVPGLAKPQQGALCLPPMCPAGRSWRQSLQRPPVKAPRRAGPLTSWPLLVTSAQNGA